MTRASKATVAGQRYLDLQREARRTGRPTDEFIQLYALECFLDRLTRSDVAANFVLKGGVLLATVPTEFSTVLGFVVAFADPLIIGISAVETWHSDEQRWT